MKEREKKGGKKKECENAGSGKKNKRCVNILEFDEKKVGEKMKNWLVLCYVGFSFLLKSCEKRICRLVFWGWTEGGIGVGGKKWWIFGSYFCWKYVGR